MTTPQDEFWAGEFGRSYTDRNTRDQASWDRFYRETWGLTKIEMNAEFVGDLSRELSFLEVGCNAGMQLVGLQRMGFRRLYGVELSTYAVAKARALTSRVHLIQGSGLQLPFEDDSFDVVFTSGVLIHVAPEELSRFMAEVVRCSKRYVWGFEYFMEELRQVRYRGREGFLWKGNYPKMFLESFPQLELLKEGLYPYLRDEHVDVMYLLEMASST